MSFFSDPLKAFYSVLWGEDEKKKKAKYEKEKFEKYKRALTRLRMIDNQVDSFSNITKLMGGEHNSLTEVCNYFSLQLEKLSNKELEAKKKDIFYTTTELRNVIRLLQEYKDFYTVRHKCSFSADETNFSNAQSDMNCYLSKLMPEYEMKELLVIQALLKRTRSFISYYYYRDHDTMYFPDWLYEHAYNQRTGHNKGYADGIYDS